MRQARLGDVTVSMKNGIYKPASEYSDDGVPCLRMYNIDGGAIVWRDIKRMRVSSKEEDEYGLREGDLLVNRVNSRELVGKTACVPPSLEPSIFESKNIRVRLDGSRVLPKFVNYQMLLGARRHFSSNAQQVVGMASISQTQLAEFPIVLTDLGNQHRIVAEIEKQFFRLSQGVANLERVKGSLQCYKAAVLKAALEGRLVPTEAELARREGRSYETGEALVEQILGTRLRDWAGRGKYRAPAPFDSANLPVLPEGWAWASLDSLSWASGYGTSAKCSYSGDGIAVLRIPNIQNGALDLDDLKFAPRDLVVPPKELVDRGDMLVIRTNGSKALVGRAAIVCEQQMRALSFASYLIRFRLCDGLRMARWMRIVWEESRLRSWIESHASTSAGQYNISQSALATAAIPVPPLEEQHRIASEVERCFSIVREVESEVDVNLLRAMSMQRAVLARFFPSSACQTS